MKNATPGSMKASAIALGGLWLLLALVQVLSPLAGDAQSRCFRAWECVVAEDRPFLPRAVWQGAAAGDLAHMTGLPHLMHRHLQVFSVDEYGFRNPLKQMEKHPQVVIVGDSFAAGSQLSDHETLSALLAADLNLVVYNEATLPLGSFYADRRFIDNPPQAVIAFYVERDLSPQLFAVNENAEPFEVQSFTSRAAYEESRKTGLRRRWREMKENIPRSSLLTRYGEPLLKSALWKLGLYAWPEKIFDYDPTDDFLFYAEGAKLHLDPQPLLSQMNEILDAVERAKNLLAARDIRLIVVVAPDKETVYHERLPQLRDKDVYEILERFTDGLDRRGIDNVKVHRTFAAYHKAHPNRPLYWPGDTHLTPLGTRLLAEALREAFQPSK